MGRTSSADCHDDWSSMSLRPSPRRRSTQRDQHHDGQHRVERREVDAEQGHRVALVPVDAQLQDAERHGREADGRQVHEAAQQQGGE